MNFICSCRWYDRSNLLIGDSGQIHVEGDNLVFESPQEIHSGNYTCVISNVAGEKRQNVWIIVSGEKKYHKNLLKNISKLNKYVKNELFYQGVLSVFVYCLVRCFGHMLFSNFKIKLCVPPSVICCFH